MSLELNADIKAPGTAVFLIHNGTTFNQRRFERIADMLKQRTNKQIITLSAQEQDGRRVVETYGLPAQGNCLVVVDEDNQIVQMWQDNEIPADDQISFLVNQFS